MNLNCCKGLVFDMDGTLVDNIQYHKEAWVIFLKEYGINIDASVFSAQNHGTMAELLTTFFNTELSSEKIKKLGEEKETAYRKLYSPHLKELEGLSPFIHQMKNSKIKIGLATMGGVNNINFIMDGLQIRPYFDAITGGHQVSNGKPDPEVFTKTCYNMKISPNDCIAFEDSIVGIKAAKGAGLHVIGVTTSHLKEELMDYGCYRTIDNYLGLASL